MCQASPKLLLHMAGANYKEDVVCGFNLGRISSNITHFE